MVKMNNFYFFLGTECITRDTAQQVGEQTEKLFSEKQGRDARPESEAVGAPLVRGPKMNQRSGTQSCQQHSSQQKVSKDYIQSDTHFIKLNII